MNSRTFLIARSCPKMAYNGWVFTNTGLKIPKFSTETEREKKADTRFEDFNPVFANTVLAVRSY